jgi:serine/threonine-protein kinase
MIGSSIGPYEIIERLGAGGMGEVYLARDGRLNRHVALKSLSDPSLDIPDARDRLLQEARAAARLSHPNIAAIHDILDCGPRPCIVMEYVQGETLAARLARGPMPPAQAVSVGIQLADGLEHAHAAGVFHRDLKPANVILTADGTAKILDFGVARIREIAPDDTTAATLADIAGAQVGQVAGTPGYMAPEQLMGRPASARSDIYSLGVLLFELVTGHRAFAASDFMGLALAILNGPMPLAHDENPGVPEEVSAVIARAMAREPRERYQSASEVKAALQRAARKLMEQSTTAAVPLPVRGRDRRADETRPAPTPAKTAARRRWLTGWRLAATVGVALAVCVLVVWVAMTSLRAASPIVAVLPLIGDDLSRDYVGVGVSDSLITALARVRPVTVVSGEETGRYLGVPYDSAKIARNHGATLLVAGNVHEAGEHVSFSVKLLRPDGRVVASNDYEGAKGELFALQRKAASDLIGALGVTLTPAERQQMDRRPTANVDAYADYSMGRALLDRYDIGGNIVKAVSAFERATSKDPNFAGAHAGLGEAYWRRYMSDQDPQWVQPAIDAVNRALKLAPDDPKCRLTLATIYLNAPGITGPGKYDQAVAAIQRALTTQPNNDEAHRLMAQVRAAQHRSEDAVREYEQAIAIRPTYLENYIALGNFQFRAGRFDDAGAAYRRVTEIQPDSPLGFLNLGARLMEGRNNQAALEHFKRVLELDANNSIAYSNIGTIHYYEGRYDEAVRAYEHAVGLAPRNAISHRNLGDAYQRLGERDKARAEYQRAADLTDELLKVNPRDARMEASHGLYTAKAGQWADAIRHAEHAIALAPADATVLYKCAVVHALAGQPEEAVKSLRQAIAHGYSRQFARTDDDLQSIRTLPQVDSLLKDQR